VAGDAGLVVGWLGVFLGRKGHIARCHVAEGIRRNDYMPEAIIAYNTEDSSGLMPTFDEAEKDQIGDHWMQHRVRIGVRRESAPSVMRESYVGEQ